MARPSGTAWRQGGPGAALRALAAAMLLAQASPASAQTPLSVPGATEAALPGTSEYAVSLVAGRAYRFLASSTAFDPMLELVGPDGAKLAEDDDSGGGLSAQIIHVARAGGVYRLRILANDLGERTGRYTLLAVETEAPRPPRAVPLALGRPIESTLGGDGDPEFRVYQVRLRANQILTATMDAVAEGEAGSAPSRARRSGLDPLLELRPADAAPTQSPLARDDDGGESFNARLRYVSPRGGDYHIYARQVGRGQGGFRLMAQVQTAEPKAITELVPGRPEQNRLTAATASLASSDSTLLSAARIFHAFRLTGRPGESFTIDVSSDEFDALVEVIGDTILGRAVIARDDNSGGENNPRLTVGFVRQGTIELRVSSVVGRDEGRYTISARRSSRAGTSVSN